MTTSPSCTCKPGAVASRSPLLPVAVAVTVRAVSPAAMMTVMIPVSVPTAAPKELVISTMKRSSGSSRSSSIIGIANCAERRPKGMVKFKLFLMRKTLSGIPSGVIPGPPNTSISVGTIGWMVEVPVEMVREALIPPRESRSVGRMARGRMAASPSRTRTVAVVHPIRRLACPLFSLIWPEAAMALPVVLLRPLAPNPMTPAGTGTAVPEGLSYTAPLGRLTATVMVSAAPAPKV